MQCPHIKQPLPTSRYAEFIGIIVDNETMLEYTHSVWRQLWWVRPDSQGSMIYQGRNLTVSNFADLKSTRALSKWSMDGLGQYAHLNVTQLFYDPD